MALRTCLPETPDNERRGDRTFPCEPKIHRRCYNFSFDAKGRAALAQPAAQWILRGGGAFGRLVEWSSLSRSAVIPRLVYGAQNAGTRKACSSL